MTVTQIRQKLLELVAELVNEEQYAKVGIKQHRGSARQQWHEGVRDAKQADANKLRRLLDEVDGEKTEVA